MAAAAEGTWFLLPIAVAAAVAVGRPLVRKPCVHPAWAAGVAWVLLILVFPWIRKEWVHRAVAWVAWALMLADGIWMHQTWVRLMLAKAVCPLLMEVGR